MAVSKAQQKAVTKYVKAKYDRFGLTMAKGKLDEIKTHAEAHSESVNGFINRAAIAETMERDGAAPAAPEGQMCIRGYNNVTNQRTACWCDRLSARNGAIPSLGDCSPLPVG